jgi:hypothetical protein
MESVGFCGLARIVWDGVVFADVELDVGLDDVECVDTADVVDGVLACRTADVAGSVDDLRCSAGALVVVVALGLGLGLALALASELSGRTSAPFAPRGGVPPIPDPVLAC